MVAEVQGLSTLPSGALLIGDEWLSDTSGGAYDHMYAGTGEQNATISLGGAAEIDLAVKAGQRAQVEWMRLTVDQRRDMMMKLAELVDEHTAELTTISVHDFAAPISMAAYHPATLARFIRYYAGWIDKLHGSVTPVSMSNDFNYVEHEPYGVVGVIVPWNGPLFVSGMSVIPALAAGNAVVLKPSELAPLGTLRFGALCLEAGMPPGLVSIVPGNAEAGDALVRHPSVGKIHFTGSGPTAQRILASASQNLTPVATELGGKASNLVFADADLDLAANLAALSGPIAQSGQSCACGSRILVEDSVYDEFVGKFLAVIEGAKIGDPFEATTAVGPVISELAADRIMGVIDRARNDGTAELLTGGNRVGGELAGGYFIEPTVFATDSNHSDLARQETFGPVVSLMRFSSEDEAVAIANDSDFGLVNYVNTTNLVRAHSVARRLQSGSIYINQMSDIVPNAPYGGYKQSGSGRAGGVEGLMEFLQVKNVRIAIPGAASLHPLSGDA